MTVVVLSGLLFASTSSLRSPISRVLTSSTLEKIINISELSTFTAVYQGIAEVKHENNKTEKPDYYVAYDANVYAGIDFTMVSFEIDQDEKQIIIDLPDVYITDISVDISSLDFMFVNQSANTSAASHEGYKACIEDVTTESASQAAILDLAEQNAGNIVKALLMPFLSQIGSDYSLVVK